MKPTRKKEKSPFMKDGTCRCCYDKRSKAVAGVLGKAHTKCVHQRGYCIGHENESDGLQVILDRWMRPGPSRAAAAIEETHHVSEPAASSDQPVAVGASSSSSSTACGAAASSAAASTDTASTETAASSAAASTVTASTETASTAAASTAAAADPAAVFTSSLSRRSARAGGAYGTTAIAERRSPSKALKTQLAAALADIEKYKAESAQSAAREAAAEAMAAAEAKAAAETAAMQTRVDAHIAKLIAERIADAATHNTSHSIGTPHVAAAIRATFAHARARATSKNAIFRKYVRRHLVSVEPIFRSGAWEGCILQVQNTSVHSAKSVPNCFTHSLGVHASGGITVPRRVGCPGDRPARRRSPRRTGPIGASRTKHGKCERKPKNRRNIEFIL